MNLIKIIKYSFVLFNKIPNHTSKYPYSKIKQGTLKAHQYIRGNKYTDDNTIKAKAKKIMAELQRKSEEAKTKEAEIQASKANEIIADAETKTKIEEAKANEIIADAKTKTKIEQDKAKKAEVKRIAEEAKTKDAEILVEAAAKKIELAEAKRKQEEVEHQVVFTEPGRFQEAHDQRDDLEAQRRQERQGDQAQQRHRGGGANPFGYLEEVNHDIGERKLRNEGSS